MNTERRDGAFAEPRGHGAAPIDNGPVPVRHRLRCDVMDTAAHHRQSPIDITRDEVTFGADLPGLSVRYPNRPVTARVCLEVKDGDPTPAGAEVVPEVVVHVAGSGAAVVLGGAEYRLDSLHWHTPS